MTCLLTLGSVLMPPSNVYRRPLNQSSANTRGSSPSFIRIRSNSMDIPSRAARVLGIYHSSSDFHGRLGYPVTNTLSSKAGYPVRASTIAPYARCAADSFAAGCVRRRYACVTFGSPTMMGVSSAISGLSTR